MRSKTAALGLLGLRPADIGSRADAAGLRLPAAEIEQIVVPAREPANLLGFTGHAGEPMLRQRSMVRAAELADEWARMSPLRMRVILVALFRRIDVSPDQLIIHFHPHQLAALLEDRLTTVNSGSVGDEPTLWLSHPVRLQRAGKEVRMVVDHTDPFASSAKPDPSLIKAIVNAHRFNENLLHGGAQKFADLAKARNCTDPTTARFSASRISPPISPPPFSKDDSPRVSPRRC